MNLQQGDCLELLKTLPDNSVDMVLTDPPYALLHPTQKPVSLLEYLIRRRMHQHRA